MLLAAYALRRHRRAGLRRGELLIAALVSVALIAAGIAPSLYNPLLEALGFAPGGERRIIGLLVLSNVLTLALLLRGLSRDNLLSDEIGALVDRLALAAFRDGGAPSLRGGCAVVLPAYNEADTLPAVLAAIPREIHGLPVGCFVIADAVTDGTDAVARAMGATVIARDLRRGSGAAVRLGYQAALGSGASVIVTMDADGQHDPLEIHRLVDPLLRGEAEMVQGSRVLGTFEVESRLRYHGVKVFSRVVSLVAGRRVTDPSTGYRAMTADCLRRLDLKQDQFYVSEMIVDAARKGMRIAEVPITFRKRAAGLTKKPPPLRYAWGFSKALVRTWLR